MIDMYQYHCRLVNRQPGPKVNTHYDAPVPGHMFHEARKRTFRMFDKWHKRPKAARKLYWRHHD